MTNDWKPRRIAIIGIGLLGGSVGLAARRRWPEIDVIGFSRSAETRELAVQVGAVTEVRDTLAEAVREAGLICVGTPVHLIADIIIEASKHCPKDAILTDVGSTKSSIVDKVNLDTRPSSMFVGGHPIAGGDKTGPQYAKADLFQQRLVVLTPEANSDPERVLKLSQFWESLGASTVQTSAKQHDGLLAATSHLPHLVAAVLASLLTPEQAPFAGSGWRDTTRVAGGCPQMWTAICQENHLAIVAHLERMIDELERFKNCRPSNRYRYDPRSTKYGKRKPGQAIRLRQITFKSQISNLKSNHAPLAN